MAQNGNKYRCHVAVSCDNSSINSTAATLTVTAPAVTPPGVLVDDFFTARDRLSGPVTSTHSVWFTDITASLYENADPDPFMLVGKPQSGTSCVWLGYFVESNTPPVHLGVGYALKATLVYTCQGTASPTTSGLRLGLFDHYDAGLRLTADGTASRARAVPPAVATRITRTGAPRSRMTSLRPCTRATTWLMPARWQRSRTTTPLAHSAAGFLGAPAFSDGTTYTMDLYVGRTASDRCSVTLSVSGGGTNYTMTAADRYFGYHRFDCIAVRPNNLETTANEFDISEFKVQVVAMPAHPTLKITQSGSNVILSWTNPPLYEPFVLEQAPAVNGPWTFVTGGETSPYTTGVTNAATFLPAVFAVSRI